MGIVNHELFCTTGGIINQIYQSLLADITADIGTPLIIIRFLHNKPLYLVILSLKCYLHFFDPYVLATIITPFILPFIYYGMYRLIKHKIALIFISSFPIITILFIRRYTETFYLVLKIYYLTIGFSGLFLLLKKKFNKVS